MRSYEMYESLVGLRSDTLQLCSSSLSEERTLVVSTIDELVGAGFYPEAGELEQTYLLPSISKAEIPSKDDARIELDTENVTRIADVAYGFTRTRFVPEERGYVFEAQTSGPPDALAVLYHASSTPVTPSQRDCSRMHLEWVGKDPSNDHSIVRQRDREFRKQFRLIESAVEQVLQY